MESAALDGDPKARGVPIRPSNYNVIIDLPDGRALAYNAYSNALAVLDPEDYDALRSVSNDSSSHDGTGPSLGQLQHGGFLVPSSMDERACLEQEYWERRNDPSRLSLTVAPTMACNFGCDYCFQGHDKPAGRMGPGVRDAIVALVRRSTHRLRSVGICWYGGEPRLALREIEQLSDELLTVCREARVPYDGSIVTSGYLLSGAVARSLVERGVVTAQVSIDGNAAAHDQRRCLLGGGGTFERLLRNMVDVAANSALRVSIRVNVDGRNAGSIVELLECLGREGLGRHGRTSIYFAPVEAITQGCHAVVGHCLTKQDFASLEVELGGIARRLGLAGRPYPGRFRGICGAVRPESLVVLPDGQLHKCWDTVSMPEHSIGNITALEQAMASDRAASWAAWNPFDHPSCRACVLLPTCAGSCAHKFLNPDQVRGEAAELPCPSWKFNLHSRLLGHALAKGLLSEADAQAAQATALPRFASVSAAGVV